MRVSTWGFFTVEPSVELQIFWLCCRAFTFATSICSLDLSVSSTFGWKSYGWPIGDDGHHLESHEKIPSINKYTLFFAVFLWNRRFQSPTSSSRYILHQSSGQQLHQVSTAPERTLHFLQAPATCRPFQLVFKVFFIKTQFPSKSVIFGLILWWFVPQIEKPQFHGIIGWWDI